MGSIRVLQPDELQLQHLYQPDRVSQHLETLQPFHPGKHRGRGHHHHPEPFFTNTVPDQPADLRAAVGFSGHEQFRFRDLGQRGCHSAGRQHPDLSEQRLLLFGGEHQQPCDQLRPDHPGHHDERQRGLFSVIEQFEPVPRHEQSRRHDQEHRGLHH